MVAASSIQGGQVLPTNNVPSLLPTGLVLPFQVMDPRQSSPHPTVPLLVYIRGKIWQKWEYFIEILNQNIIKCCQRGIARNGSAPKPTISGLIQIYNTQYCSILAPFLLPSELLLTVDMIWAVTCAVYCVLGSGRVD